MGAILKGTSYRPLRSQRKLLDGYVASVGWLLVTAIFPTLCAPLRALECSYNCSALRALSLRDDISPFRRIVAPYRALLGGRCVLPPAALTYVRLQAVTIVSHFERCRFATISCLSGELSRPIGRY